MTAEIPTGPQVVDDMKMVRDVLDDAISKSVDGKVDLGELAMMFVTHGPRIAKRFGVNVPSLGN